VAERLETVGAKMSSGALRDMAWVTVRSLTEEKVLDTTLSTFSAVLAKPAFIEKDLERTRETILSALQQEAESPAEIAQKAFYSALYNDHPYASNPNGTKESIKGITLKDIKDFHQQYYAASNAVIAMVGDLTLEQAHSIAQRTVADLPAGQHAKPLAEPQLAETSKIISLEHPSSQTHIHMGQPGIKRGDPDYFPLYVGNHILGGSGLVSILSGEVREKRGLSYSVYSYFIPMRVAGPFKLGAQTKNSQAQQAIKVMNETLQRYIAEGPTDEELKAAKDNISGGFPMKISSNSKIVEYLAMIGFYGLPLDYLDQLVPNVLAVSSEQIKEAFRKHVNPDRLVTVTVGQNK
jgi:zinc protease